MVSVRLKIAEGCCFRKVFYYHQEVGGNQGEIVIFLTQATLLVILETTFFFNVLSFSVTLNFFTFISAMKFSMSLGSASST